MWIFLFIKKFLNFFLKSFIAEEDLIYYGK